AAVAVRIEVAATAGSTVAARAADTARPSGASFAARSAVALLAPALETAAGHPGAGARVDALRTGLSVGSAFRVGPAGGEGEAPQAEDEGEADDPLHAPLPLVDRRAAGSLHATADAYDLQSCVRSRLDGWSSGNRGVDSPACPTTRRCSSALRSGSAQGCWRTP